MAAEIVRCGTRTDRGVSLIEVVIAMALLAIGLLALQALGIAVSRAVAGAEQNTRNAAIVSRFAELSISKLSRDSLPTDLDCALSGGGRLIRVVTLAQNARGARFEVTLVPPGASGTREMRVSGYAFSPNGFAASSEAEPCP